MNRRNFCKHLSLIPVVMLAGTGCGPHHKSKPAPGLTPGTTASEWPASVQIGPYEVHVHKSWGFRQAQCLLAAVESHWFAWKGSQRATLRIGADHRGKIWIYGSGANVFNPAGQHGDSCWAPDSGAGKAIHVLVKDHRLPSLNHAIDFHQDPLLENAMFVAGRRASVEIDERLALVDAYARQQFLGCH